MWGSKGSVFLKLLPSSLSSRVLNLELEEIGMVESDKGIEGINMNLPDHTGMSQKVETGHGWRATARFVYVHRTPYV